MLTFGTCRDFVTSDESFGGSSVPDLVLNLLSLLRNQWTGVTVLSGTDNLLVLIHWKVRWLDFLVVLTGSMGFLPGKNCPKPVLSVP